MRFHLVSALEGIRGQNKFWVLSKSYFDSVCEGVEMEWCVARGQCSLLGTSCADRQVEYVVAAVAASQGERPVALKERN